MADARQQDDALRADLAHPALAETFDSIASQLSRAGDFVYPRP